jgi:hypothetical protein
MPDASVTLTSVSEATHLARLPGVAESLRLHSCSEDSLELLTEKKD